jgi:hypothetical protein
VSGYVTVASNNGFLGTFLGKLNPDGSLAVDYILGGRAGNAAVPAEIAAAVKAAIAQLAATAQ